MKCYTYIDQFKINFCVVISKDGSTNDQKYAPKEIILAFGLLLSTLYPIYIAIKRPLNKYGLY